MRASCFITSLIFCWFVLLSLAETLPSSIGWTWNEQLLLWSCNLAKYRCLVHDSSLISFSRGYSKRTYRLEKELKVQVIWVYLIYKRSLSERCQWIFLKFVVRKDNFNISQTQNPNRIKFIEQAQSYNLS